MVKLSVACFACGGACWSRAAASYQVMNQIKVLRNYSAAAQAPQVLSMFCARWNWGVGALQGGSTIAGAKKTDFARKVASGPQSFFIKEKSTEVEVGAPALPLR